MSRPRLRSTFAVSWVAAALLGGAAACGSSSGSSGAQPQPAPAQKGPSYEELVRVARSYVERGNPERAAAVAERAAKEQPERPEAYGAWGFALASDGKLAEAAAKYERALELGSQDRQVYLELSSVYDVAQQYERAVKVYEAWLHGHPDDGEMWQELGLTQLLRDELAPARAALSRAVELRPDDVQARIDLGHVSLRSHDPAAAVRQLEVALQREPGHPDAMRLMAQAQAALGHADQARKVLDQLLAAHPDDERALRVRARLRQLEGDAAGALDDYGRVLKIAGKDAGALLGAAGALIELGRLDDAQKAVGAAREAAGDLPEVRFRQAQIKLRRKQPGGLQEMAAAAEALPDAVEVWRELHAAAKQAGDKQLADKSRKRLGELGER